MVAAVDAARARCADRGAARTVEKRMNGYLNVVRDAVLWFGESVRQLCCHRGGDVLNQCPACGDIQDLRAAADREQWHILVDGAPGEVEFELIARGLRIVDRLVAILSVEGGIDIAAA